MACPCQPWGSCAALINAWDLLREWNLIVWLSWSSVKIPWFMTNLLSIALYSGASWDIIKDYSFHYTGAGGESDSWWDVWSSERVTFNYNVILAFDRGWISPLQCATGNAGNMKLSVLPSGILGMGVRNYTSMVPVTLLLYLCHLYHLFVLTVISSSGLDMLLLQGFRQLWKCWVCPEMCTPLHLFPSPKGVLASVLLSAFWTVGVQESIISSK